MNKINFKPLATKEFRVPINPLNWLWLPFGIILVLLSIKWDFGLEGMAPIFCALLVLTLMYFWFGVKAKSIFFNGSVVTITWWGKGYPPLSFIEYEVFQDREIPLDILRVQAKGAVLLIGDQATWYWVASGAYINDLLEWLKNAGIVINTIEKDS